MSKTRNLALIVLIILVALALGMWSKHNTAGANHAANKLQNNENLVATKTATVLPQPRPLKEFKLVSDTSQPFTNENLKNHWTMIFFGFTHCPSICPTTLSTLNKAYTSMQAAGMKSVPQVLFISVDPDQDSPAVIKSYIQGFNKNFLGATGTKAQIDALTQQFNVMYMKVAERGEAGKQGKYSVDHSGTILITDPKGELFAIFSAPHVASKLVDDMKVIERDYSKTQG